MDQGLAVQEQAPEFVRPGLKRHRAFCHAVSSGMQPYQAYRKYVSKPNDPKTAYERGSRLCRQFGSYIAHLRVKLSLASI